MSQTTGPYAHPDLLLATAAAGLPNGRGHPCQDRWATGQLPHGGWLIVADGITGGTRGETAAEAAVTVADRVLRGSDLLEGAALTAVEAAHTAVRPWYTTSHGGTTLTVLTLTRHRIVVAQVGDSPAFLLHSGALQPLTPSPRPGPLTAWIGQPQPLTPWLDSWPTDGDTCAVVCSDGLTPTGIHFTADSTPESLVLRLLRCGRNPNLDDATAAAITLIRNP